MLVSCLIMLILSSAVINEKEKSITYCRMSIQGLLLTSFILYNNLFISSLEKGIGLYGGMFNVNIFTQSFNLFVIVIVSIILILTSFNPASIHSFDILTKYESVKYFFVSGSLKKDAKTNDELEYSSTKGYVTTLSEKMLKILHSPLIHTMNKNIKKFGQYEIMEYALIIVFILCGAIFLMSTIDLISMFLSIELQSYGLYILSTLYRDSESATNSGLTYFLLGGMSSCFILLGSGILYVNSGTTNIENIYILNSMVNANNNILSPELLSLDIPSIVVPNYVSISLIIIIVGFLFKVSAAPFHFWSPDVYDGIPTVVTTFVAIVPKVSIFIFMLQLLLNMYFMPTDNYIDHTGLYYTDTITNTMSPLTVAKESNEILFDSSFGKWRDVITISSLMSLIIGSLLGLTQYRIKRLFAYSTISHVGFILLALVVGTIESIQGYIFYILQYTISNINAFFILIAMGYILNSNSSSIKSDNLVDTSNSPVQLIRQLKGCFHINSYISISLAITLFSFVGIPPLIGFFAKQMVLSAALAEGYVFMTLVAVVTSVVAAVYYLNIIKIMFFSKDNSVRTDLEIKLPQKIFYDSRSPVKISYYNTVKINSGLSIIITVLTIIILTFIFVPNEWLRVASILSITVFKL